MPTVVAKIIEDDGDEVSCGPVEVDEADLADFRDAMQPFVDQTFAEQEAAFARQVEEETARRNQAAADLQAEREAIARSGEDPDNRDPEGA